MPQPKPNPEPKPKPKPSLSLSLSLTLNLSLSLTLTLAWHPVMKAATSSSLRKLSSVTTHGEGVRVLLVRCRVSVDVRGWG